MGPALVGEVFGSNICEVVRDPALDGEVFGSNMCEVFRDPALVAFGKVFARTSVKSFGTPRWLVRFLAQTCVR